MLSLLAIMNISYIPISIFPVYNKIPLLKKPLFVKRTGAFIVLFS